MATAWSAHEDGHAYPNKAAHVTCQPSFEAGAAARERTKALSGVADFLDTEASSKR